MSHPDNPTWPNVIAKNLEISQSGEMLVDFLRSIDRIDMKPEHFKGNIAVIGQGSAFPERALLTVDKYHGELNSDISLIACFDSAFFSNPGLLLNTQEIFAPEGNELKQLPYGSVVYYPYGAGYAFDRYKVPSNFFNTVLAFQIVDLGDQLRDGLFQSIMNIIKPGGFFIGSGGMRKLPNDYYEQVTADPANHARIIQKVRLSDFAPSGYPFTNHTGVILQKI